MRHGRGVQHLQDALHLNFERSVNRFVADHEPIAQVMNYYYATLHFIVTLGCLIWLYRSHPRIYRGARTILFATSLIALAGFYLYPLAPPRLLPQYGYIDTVLKFHTWGSLADPKIAEHSNQYAAMPSLHIGWALWCGVSIYLCARRRLGARAGRGLPGVHPAGHRRHRQPLRHRRGRRARGLPRRLRGAVPVLRPQRLRRGPDPPAPAEAGRREQAGGRGGSAARSSGRPTRGCRRSAEPSARLVPRRQCPAQSPVAQPSVGRVVEHRLDHPAGPAGDPPVVVDQLAGLEAGRVAQHPADRLQHPAGLGQLVLGPVPHQHDRVAHPAGQPPGRRQRRRVVGGQRAGVLGRPQRGQGRGGAQPGQLVRPSAAAAAAPSTRRRPARPGRAWCGCADRRRAAAARRPPGP